MALTTARKKANAKYEAKAYDKTLIRLPKGRLDEIRAHIEPAGESLNGFIGRAITETMERDGGEDTVTNHDSIHSGGAAAPGTVQQEAGTAQAGRVVYRVLAADTAGTPQEAAETSTGAGVVSLPPDTLEAAERAAKRTGETVPDFVARAVAEQQKRDDRSFKMGINPA